MSRTTARAAAMQMIFEKISGGQGGEDTLKMVYDELREDGLPGVTMISRKEPDEEDRGYITAALEGVLAHREEIDEMIEKTSTKNAPWHIIESNDKKYARIKTLKIIVDALEIASEQHMKKLLS